MKALVTMLMLMAGAAAAGASHAEEEPGACHADVEKFCKGVAPGGGAVARCLSQHRAELSPQCRKNISKGAKRAGKLAKACKSDSEKLCKQTKSGGGRLLRCLSSNKAQLSDQCRQKVEEAEKRHPCLGDINRLCSNVEPGKGRMDQCLNQHRAEVTAQCRAALDKAPKKKK